MRIARGLTIAALGASTLVACGGSDAGGDEGSFCDAVREVDESDVSPDTDPDAAAKLLRDLAEKAPSEIEAEFTSFSATLDAVANEDAEALAQVDFDEVQANITTIGEYIGDNCDGIADDVFDL